MLFGRSLTRTQEGVEYRVYEQNMLELDIDVDRHGAAGNRKRYTCTGTVCELSHICEARCDVYWYSMRIESYIEAGCDVYRYSMRIESYIEASASLLGDDPDGDSLDLDDLRLMWEEFVVRRYSHTPRSLP